MSSVVHYRSFAFMLHTTQWSIDTDRVKNRPHIIEENESHTILLDTSSWIVIAFFTDLTAVLCYDDLDQIHLSIFDPDDITQVYAAVRRSGPLFQVARRSTTWTSLLYIREVHGATPQSIFSRAKNRFHDFFSIDLMPDLSGETLARRKIMGSCDLDFV